MHRRQKKYQIYRLSLFAYPKSYRQQFGEQMVQTLQDMLDGADTSLNRTGIWLRIIAETPMSALKENINNIGENGMSKLTSISNKRLVIGGVVIAVIALAATLGFWRNAIVGRASNMFYGNALRALVDTQDRKLAGPFTRFGMQAPKPKSDCSVGPSSFTSMHIDCEAVTQGYTKLGQSAADKANILASVAAVESALKSEGYSAGSNGVTLTSLVAGTYEGKDYSPDAAYEKNIGNQTCLFDTLIAYANPNQPAIHMSMWCNRTFDIFGKQPNNVWYSKK